MTRAQYITQTFTFLVVRHHPSVNPVSLNDQLNTANRMADQLERAGVAPWLIEQLQDAEKCKAIMESYRAERNLSV